MLHLKKNSILSPRAIIGLPLLGEQSIKLMWILLMQSQIYPTEPGHGASQGDIMIADNSTHTK